MIYMGWNQRSSGHCYDSLFEHAFVIGVYTRRIIGCVVFIKTYTTYRRHNGERLVKKTMVS